MSYGVVSRPKAAKDRIHSREEFELCYLRHQYLRKAGYNPTQEEIDVYSKIVDKFVRSTYFTYLNLFKSIGLDHSDILNIGQVHVVSFIGLFALERNPVKKKEFEDLFALINFKEPEPQNYVDKNKANFTTFFKQRMEDLVRVCRQKVKNVQGKIAEEFNVFCGTNPPPRNPRRILKDHVEFGYKRIDTSVFKSIRKKANVDANATMFKFGDTWYIALTRQYESLCLEDIIGGGSNPYENTHNMQPDEIFEEKEFVKESDKFQDKSLEYKIRKIRIFIAKNKNKRQYKEEVTTARKMLRQLGN